LARIELAKIPKSGARDHWNLLFIADMWFQDLFSYDFPRTEQCTYATQEGDECCRRARATLDQLPILTWVMEAHRLGGDWIRPGLDQD